MALLIERAVIDKQFGSEDALRAAVIEYQAAREAHASSEGVPAPTAHPLVEEIVVFQGGEFEIVEPPPLPEPEEPARRMVPKSLIIERLNAAGRLAAAKAVLDADLYTRERWYAPDRPALYFDDAEALALLAAIGADPDVIMAS
jgi:hypothetical protein